MTAVTPARSRRRMVYVKAEPKSRLDRLREWGAFFWPIIIIIGGGLWAWASSEWHDYYSLKRAVGTEAAGPRQPATGLHKTVDDLSTKIDTKANDLSGKIEKLSDGQKETHSLVRDLSSQIDKVAKTKR